MPLPKKTVTAEDYWNLPEGKRGELLDGKIRDLAAPSREHQFIQSRLITEFNRFIDDHDGTCEVYGSPFAVNLFADDTTFVEPDVSIVCDDGKLSDRGCEGAPDLIVEIVSPSTRQRDYSEKQAKYNEAGVREYWVVDPSMSRTTVFRFETDPAPMIYAFARDIDTRVLPGLTVNIGQIVNRIRA